MRRKMNKLIAFIIPSQWLISPMEWKECIVKETLTMALGSRVRVSEGTQSIPAEQCKVNN